ncbi:MAG: carboxypeptidase regulatory-like domain-containing protein [Methanoculleaceae archaeon]
MSFRRLPVALLLTLMITGMGVQAHRLTINVIDRSSGTPVPDAGVYIDGEFSGRTDSSGMFTYDHAGTAEIRVKVSKAGYNPWMDTIGPTTTAVEVPLSRALVTLNVEVYDQENVQPVADAVVKVSGEDSSEVMYTDEGGRVDFTLPAEGEYTLEIQAPNYYTLLRSVSVGRSDMTVQYWLTRSDMLAIQVLDGETGSPVEGAEVIADGITYGVTDGRGILSLHLSREETHTIQVEAPTYRTSTTERYLTCEDAVLTVPLYHESSPLTIAVFDQDRIPVKSAAISIDGRIVGETDDYGRFSAGPVEAGVHLIGVSAPGYMDWSENRTILGGGEDLVVVLQYDTTRCTIIVEDRGKRVVPGATIIIDSEVVGHTDETGRFTTPLVSHHTHNITAEATGYSPSSVNVEIPQGIAEKTVILTLEEAPSPVIIGGLVTLIIAAFVTGAFIQKYRRTRRQKTKTRSGDL